MKELYDLKLSVETIERVYSSGSNELESMSVKVFHDGNALSLDLEEEMI